MFAVATACEYLYNRQIQRALSMHVKAAAPSQCMGYLMLSDVQALVSRPVVAVPVGMLQAEVIIWAELL